MVMVQGCLRYHFLSMESAIPFQVNSWKSVTNETVEKKDDIYVTVCVFEVFVRRGRDDMQTRASKQTDPPPCSKSLRYAVNEPPLYRNSFLIILGFNIFFNIVAQEFYLRLIDCHDLYLILTRLLTMKHFLRSKEAILKYISELNLVYFVLILD